MNRNVTNTRRDAAIEERIDALSVNAAHREMARIHYRHGVAAADRAFELIESLRCFAGTIRKGAPGLWRSR